MFGSNRKTYHSLFTLLVGALLVASVMSNAPPDAAIMAQWPQATKSGVTKCLGYPQTVAVRVYSTKTASGAVFQRKHVPADMLSCLEQDKMINFGQKDIVSCSTATEKAALSAFQVDGNGTCTGYSNVVVSTCVGEGNVVVYTLAPPRKGSSKMCIPVVPKSIALATTTASAGAATTTATAGAATTTASAGDAATTTLQ